VNGEAEAFLGRFDGTGTSGSGNGNGSGTGVYKVTLESIGSDTKGGGDYLYTVKVDIDAGIMPKPWMTPFEKWTTTSKGVVFEDSTSATTSFRMPANNVTIKANFLDLLRLGSFTDSRNGKTYKTTTVGISGRTWMAENLNFPVGGSGSACYNNDNSYCDIYGRLYERDSRAIACPQGWRLPNKDDVDELIGDGDLFERMADYEFLEQKGGTYYSWCTPPCYDVSTAVPAFRNNGSEATWWCDECWGCPGMGGCMGDGRAPFNHQGTGPLMLSVRCVKN
jgi:uncharacterized protein (TIGR02145 family)